VLVSKSTKERERLLWSPGALGLTRIGRLQTKYLRIFNITLWEGLSSILICGCLSTGPAQLHWQASSPLHFTHVVLLLLSYCHYRRMRRREINVGCLFPSEQGRLVEWGQDGQVSALRADIGLQDSCARPSAQRFASR
jgi:hypothetical protein